MMPSREGSAVVYRLAGLIPPCAQPLGLGMKDVPDQEFLIVGFEVDEFRGDRKPVSVCLRDDTNHFCLSLDEGKRRKDQFDREVIA